MQQIRAGGGSEHRPEGGGHRSSQRDRIPDSDKCQLGQRVALLSRGPRTLPSPSQGQDWAPEDHVTAPLMTSGVLYPLQLHLKLDCCSWQESILKFSEILCTNWETLLLSRCHVRLFALQAESLPLSQQGSPADRFFITEPALPCPAFRMETYTSLSCWEFWFTAKCPLRHCHL